MLALLLAITPLATPTETPQPQNSGRLANREFTVESHGGSGIARYFGNGSLDGSPSATRAIIIVHGSLRDADYYYDTGLRVLADAAAHNTLLLAPQFVESDDLKGQDASPQTLRWNDNWPGGSDAIAPAPISTYAVFDAMIERLADATRFPKLREIVLMGHSAGGQIVQRYGAVGKAPQLDGASHVKVHLIVSNPSSYLYFDDTRPFVPANCPSYNLWRYELTGAPDYVSGTPVQVEARYVARHVTYLLGTADTNPNESDLDRSCAGEAEGPYRFARGKNYIAYIKERHPYGTAQDYAFVLGVPHDNRRMFTSQCGLAVIFGRPQTSCAEHGRI